MRHYTGTPKLLLIVFISCSLLHAQTTLQGNKNQSSPFQQPTHDSNYNLQPGVDPENEFVSPFVRHIAEDQKHFWTFPARFKVQDLKWIMPLAGGAAALIASDSWVSKQVPNRPNQLNFGKHVSDY